MPEHENVSRGSERYGPVGLSAEEDLHGHLGPRKGVERVVQAA